MLPTVHSLHPLWNRASLDSVLTGAEREDRVLAEGHEVLQTSELDGAPERRLEMPEDSVVPAVTAAALLTAVVALLLGATVVAAVAVVGAAAAIGYWLWPFPGPQEALEEPVPHPERVS